MLFPTQSAAAPGQKRQKTNAAESRRQAGLIGGRFLGRWAKRTWDGEVDEILLIELQRAGSLPQARIRGLVSGISEVIRIPETCKMVSVDGDGQFQTSLERVRKAWSDPAPRFFHGTSSVHLERMRDSGPRTPLHLADTLTVKAGSAFRLFNCFFISTSAFK